MLRILSLLVLVFLGAAGLASYFAYQSGHWRQETIVVATSHPVCPTKTGPLRDCIFVVTTKDGQTFEDQVTPKILGSTDPTVIAGLISQRQLVELLLKQKKLAEGHTYTVEVVGFKLDINALNIHWVPQIVHLDSEVIARASLSSGTFWTVWSN